MILYRVAREAVIYKIRVFEKADSSAPFDEWIDGLPGKDAERIDARLARMEMGNLGDYKSVGGGVLEARFTFGPGYRVYFGFHEKTVVLLLCGGTKQRQSRDITIAQEYWAEFLEETNG